MKEVTVTGARFLHTMLRVRDVEQSIQFYKQHLGMKVLRRQDFSTEGFTLVFLGYDEEERATVLELTENWGINQYDIGNAYGHIAIGVHHIFNVCAKLEKQGVKIIRAPNPMAYSDDRNGPRDLIAFIKDPDGYKIELIEKK